MDNSFILSSDELSPLIPASFLSCGINDVTLGLLDREECLWEVAERDLTTLAGLTGEVTFLSTTLTRGAGGCSTEGEGRGREGRGREGRGRGRKGMGRGGKGGKGEGREGKGREVRGGGGAVINSIQFMTLCTHLTRVLIFSQSGCIIDKETAML